MRSFTRRHSRLVLFHKYLQWQVDLQLAAAQEHARRRGMLIGLYHDLALATEGAAIVSLLVGARFLWRAAA